MLSHLTIENLALIDHLDLPLDEGLTVITGETGAGKSMMLNALSLVLGGRASASLVRTGAPRARVEAIFELPPERRAFVADVLECGGELSVGGGSPGAPERELPEQLIVRREVAASGRSKVFVNGSATRLAVLRELTRGLLDISAQHEYTSLLDPASYLGLIDAYGGTVASAASVAAGAARLRRIEREVRDLAARVREREARADYLRFQLDELEGLAISAEDLSELESEALCLQNADEIREGCELGAYLVRDGDRAMVDELAQLVDRLESLADADAELACSVELLVSARVQLVEAASGLEQIAQRVEADPERLAEIDDRLSEIERVRRKHCGPGGGEALGGMGELMARAEAMRQELACLDSAEGSIEALVAEHARLLDAMTLEARTLSAARAEAASRLEQAIERELHSLGMAGARFEVRIEPVEADRTALAGGEGGRNLEGGGLEGGRPDDPDAADAQPAGSLPGRLADHGLTASGFDRATMRLAPNPGEPAGALAKVASGGELSRVLLALKAALMATDPIPTVVFDEVDAGIGGEIADAVGHKMQEVAGSERQVLAITHLPQIAACADHHIRVAKQTRAGRTVTEVIPLDAEARVAELARMLGGGGSGPKGKASAPRRKLGARLAAAKAHASALLEQAGGGLQRKGA